MVSRRSFSFHCSNSTHLSNVLLLPSLQVQHTKQSAALDAFLDKLAMVASWNPMHILRRIYTTQKSIKNHGPKIVGHQPVDQEVIGCFLIPFYRHKTTLEDPSSPHQLISAQDPFPGGHPNEECHFERSNAASNIISPKLNFFILHQHLEKLFNCNYSLFSTFPSNCIQKRVHVFEFLILEILDEFWVLTASCLRAYSATISYPFFTILNISKKVAFKKAPHGHHAKISILAHLLFVEYMLRDHFPLS